MTTPKDDDVRDAKQAPTSIKTTKTDEDLDRLLKYAGSITSGNPVGTNEEIDTDLGASYSDDHESR
jgi:hypothetical protein